MNQLAFIFDMDGVIVDSEPVYWQFSTELYEELQLNVDDDARYSFIGGSSTRKWQYLKDHFSLEKSVEELIKFQRERFSERKWDFKKILFPEVLPFLTELKKNNIPTALASSSDKKRINLVLDQCELQHYFNHTVSGEDFEKGKPHPDIFLAAAEKLGVSPSNCVVVEDSFNGITAAKEAKMYAIGVKHKKIKMDLTRADRVINSLSELAVINFS